MSDLTTRDLQDSWACKHVQGELSPEQRRVELLELLDQVCADAWDEGVLYAHERHNNHAGLSPSWKFDNPYRADRIADQEGDE